jgi:hypothetical protein
MSVEQRWILNGLIGGMLLLLFPPFLYGPSGAGRQWHFLLDSRRPFYAIAGCNELSRDNSSLQSAPESKLAALEAERTRRECL